MCRVRKNYLIITTILALFPFSGLTVDGISFPNLQNAYGDGLVSETLPPVLVDGNLLSLYAKLEPNYLTEGSSSNVTLQLRLFDTLTDQTIGNVTYVIFLGKFDPMQEQGVRGLLNAAFFSEAGPLKLNIIPTDDENNEMDSSKKPPLDAWVASGPLGTIYYQTSQVFDGGLYYVGVVVAGVHDPDNLFSPETAPDYVAGLSIGHAIENSVEYLDSVKNVTIVSYYDKISDFAFDQENEIFSWSMAFNWDAETISSKNILVHHEIRIPKSISTLSETASLEGSINGARLAGRNLAIDPYSSAEYVTVHYILNKPDILSLSQNVDALTTEEMTFQLSVSPANGINFDNDERSRTILITDGSGIQATIDFDQLAVGKPSEMNIKFSDVLTQDPLDVDVSYDPYVMDSNGKQISAKPNLIARSGLDVQEVMFPTDESYYIEMNVKGFLLYQADDTDKLSPILDASRAGIARGAVVVPEFPYQSTIVIIGALFGSLVILGKKQFGKITSL